MKDKFDPKFVVELLKRLPVQVFWKDINGVYLGCNDAFVHSLGLSSQDEIIGKTDFTLSVKIKEAAAYRQDDLEVIKTNHPKLNIEEEQTFPDGKKVYLLTSKVPLSIEQNGFNGILGIFSDITDLKLTQEQLKSEKEKSEIASKSKSAFIANMSHDIRTPITGMLGMIQDMLNVAKEAQSSANNNAATTLTSLIKTIQQDSNILMGSTDELLQFCNEILEIVRLESGKLDSNLEAFSVREMIEHNIELLKPVAHHKKLQFACDIDQQVPQHVSGRRIYLDRVLLNLMSNALKFTEEGSVTVSVVTDKNGNDHKIGDSITLQIAVEDTGIGIPTDKFDIIFENFSRLTPAYEGLYKGAGLGLYTVKRYVEAMQGTIHVESEIGHGTCFTVTLPMFVSDHGDREKKSLLFANPLNIAPDNIHLKKHGLSPKDAKASILIVEDHELAAYAVSVPLRPFECHVDMASNGTNAVKMAQESHYDLILMDIGLPDLSGIEVTKKIRSFDDPQKSQVPIIALTGHANNPDIRQEAIDAGMQEIISKPAQRLILESILQNYVFQAKPQALPTQKAVVPEDKTTESSAVIDWDACVRMCSGDPKLTRKLLKMMADDSKNIKAVLAKAYVNRNSKALRDELHRVRGGVCYLKLPQLEKTLKAFHQAVKADPQDERALEGTYTALQEAMNAYWDTWNSGKF